MEDPNKSTGIYTVKEQGILDFVMNKRLEMVEANFKNGAPESTGEQRVTNEILTALSNDIHTAAANRLKDESIKSDAEIKQHMAALLKEKANRRAKQADRPVDAKIETSDSPIEKPNFVPGELEIDPVVVTYEEIMGDE